MTPNYGLIPTPLNYPASRVRGCARSPDNGRHISPPLYPWLHACFPYPDNGDAIRRNLTVVGVCTSRGIVSCYPVLVGLTHTQCHINRPLSIVTQSSLEWHPILSP